MELAIATIQHMIKHENDPDRKLLLLDALESLQRYQILVDGIKPQMGTLMDYFKQYGSE